MHYSRRHSADRIELCQDELRSIDEENNLISNNFNTESIPHYVHSISI